MRIFKLLFLSAIIASACLADIINVPDDFETIQAGIDAAEDGDTVLVAPGVYVENIDFLGKDITVASRFLLTGDLNIIEETIIDGNQDDCVVSIESEEEISPVMSGFTIRNGLGGIFISVTTEQLNACPCIKDNIFEDNLPCVRFPDFESGCITVTEGSARILNNTVCFNESNTHGGGAHIAFCSHIIIENNVFHNNESTDRGGAIFIRNVESSTLRNNLIYNNIGSMGGGISLHEASPLIVNNTICFNTTHQWEGEAGGGLYSEDSEPVILVNNIIYGNTSARGAQVWSDDEELIIRYSDIEGGFEGQRNIDADPLFVDPENGDYNLTADSPCIDAGDPEAELDPDGTRADMGAFHYHQRDIDVNPLEVQFPPIEWDTFDSLSVTISNIGRTGLTIDSIGGCLTMSCIWMNEENRDEWEPIVIEPQGIVDLWIYYRPQVGAIRERTFWIYSDDPDEPEITVHAEGDVIDAVKNDCSLPDFFHLVSAYPNPFNASTTITYTLPIQSNVTLQVYNTRGQLVDVLLDKVMPAGRHSLVWDGSKFSTGVYLVRMVDQDRSSKEIQKVVLVK